MGVEREMMKNGSGEESDEEWELGVVVWNGS